MRALLFLLCLLTVVYGQYDKKKIFQPCYAESLLRADMDTTFIAITRDSIRSDHNTIAFTDQNGTFYMVAVESANVVFDSATFTQTVTITGSLKVAGGTNISGGINADTILGDTLGYTAGKITRLYTTTLSGSAGVVTLGDDTLSWGSGDYIYSAGAGFNIKGTGTSSIEASAGNATLTATAGDIILTPNNSFTVSAGDTSSVAVTGKYSLIVTDDFSLTADSLLYRTGIAKIDTNYGDTTAYQDAHFDHVEADTAHGDTLNYQDGHFDHVEADTAHGDTLDYTNGAIDKLTCPAIVSGANINLVPTNKLSMYGATGIICSSLTNYEIEHTGSGGTYSIDWAGPLNIVTVDDASNDGVITIDPGDTTAMKNRTVIDSAYITNYMTNPPLADSARGADSLDGLDGADYQLKADMDDSVARFMLLASVNDSLLAIDSSSTRGAKIQDLDVDTIHFTGPDTATIDASSKRTKIRDTVYVEVFNYNPPHGVFGFRDSAVTIAMAEDDTSQITNSEGNLFTQLEINDMTFLAGDTVKITKPGDYEVIGSITFGAANGDSIDIGIWKVGTGLVQFGTDAIMTGVQTKAESISLYTYIVNAAVDDKYIMYARNVANDNDIVVISSSVSIKMVHP